MFLRIVRVRSAEQSGIKGGKRPFDPNIITYRYHFRIISNKNHKNILQIMII